MKFQLEWPHELSEKFRAAPIYSLAGLYAHWKLGFNLTSKARRKTDQRSVVFLHHAYYNFYYLAAALRKRGWDAISVSVISPDHPDQMYFHGEDVCLFDPDLAKKNEKIRNFVRDVPSRFRMVHFYGRGTMSFFPELADITEHHDGVPIDFLYFKHRGLKIGYTTSGCFDGTSQSTFRRWSKNCCDRCIWQDNDQVCSDTRNLSWGNKIDRTLDLFATEGNPALDHQGTDYCFREPLTQALDSEFWHPDLKIPDEMRVDRAENEILVYHGVGNLEQRSSETKNAKGTPAVVSAIEKLRSEGFPVRLIFATNIPNKDVRFLQLQCDIVVDQLNFGRYGSTSRESLMLGRPTVCRIDSSEKPGARALTSLKQCPIVSADERSIYDVLKALVSDRDRLTAIGKQSREFALKWFSMDRCAERFEEVYDSLMSGVPAIEIEKRMFDDVDL